MKFLTLEGLAHFWEGAKAKIAELYVAKESGKGLSTNDYTTAEKTKLEGIDEGANKYTHPAYAAKSAGLYKVTVDNTGHVSAATPVAKADITDLGIPGQDTTYSPMTGASASAAGTAGLVPAPAAGKQGQFLRGDGTWAAPTTYTHPNSGVTAGTYKSVTVNAQGHVTAGSNPTTLAGYGITDAAAKSHTHGNADITALDASKITGIIGIDHLPAGALERCIVVADDTARKALTTAQVQTGDTVKVTSTGLMYFVVDDTKLSTDAGYQVYTAGSATSVPWSGVTGKPSTFTPATHTHTKSQITDFPASLKNPTALTIQLNGTAAATYDGSTAKSVNITPVGIGAVATADMAEITTAEIDALFA